MSTIVSVTEGLTTALNAAPGGTFALPFTAQRYYRLDWQLEQLADLKVSVQPGTVERVALTRKTINRTVAIAILVQQRVEAETTAAIDPLTLLCEAIADFVGPSLNEAVGAEWVATEHSPIYDPEHMKDYSVFTCPVLCSFRY